MKYGGNVTILDDQGNVVYERELNEEQMLDELLRKPDPVTDAELDAALNDAVSPPADERAATFEKGSGRRCGLCGKTGHSRTTCGGPAKAKETKGSGRTAPGCDECGSKGWKHKKGCTARPVQKKSASIKTFAKGTPAGKDLDKAEAAWHNFKPKLSAMQYSEIKDMQMDGKNSVQIHAEMDLPAADIQQVNFVMQSKNYEAYRSLARRAEFG